VKFTGQVLPSARVVSYAVDISRVIKGRMNVVVANGTVHVDGRQIYTATDMRVGLFQSTEGF
jgi:3-hydroxyacyl-[acyl-carrier protein] dehydratase/trans-2-decenoyl-[acyl-carrier protein] isomerase